jgi:16S rRNA (cytosine1402-N4)-methyltransferase
LSKFLPAHKSHKILAQIYQAIRIEVNQEMEVLKEFLEQSLDVLKPGRKIECYFISFIRR